MTSCRRLTRPILLLIALLAAAGAVRAADWSELSAADLEYVYDGRPVRLDPVLDEVAVALEPGQALSGHPLLAREGEATAEGLTLYRLAAKAGDWRGLAESLDELAKDPAVRWSAPVFAVGSARMIPTDGLIVGGGTAAATAAGLRLDATLPEAGHVALARVRDGGAADAWLEAGRLARDPSVDFSHPNFVRVLPRHATPNDTHFDEQWALHNVGQTGGGWDADLDGPEAWDVNHGNGTVTVAIIDEGVDLAHEDLDDRLVTGYDAVDDDDDPTPNPWDGHGTACAGIAAAEGNNGRGVAGVAWDVSILPVRIGFSASEGATAWTTSDWWLALGIQTAWVRGADVLSNSWGGGSPVDVVDFAIDGALANGRGGLGSVVVFSAGNDFGPVSWPGSRDGVLTVSASNEFDEFKTPASADGETWWGSNSGPEVDVAAPGVHVWTTDISGADGYNDGADGDAAGHYFERFNGTSAAAPHAAGVAALVLSYDPDLTGDEAADAVRDGADDLGDPGFDTLFGHGRVNALGALEAVHGAQTVSGTLAEDTTWFSGRTYLLTSHVTVPAGVTLTIEPGAVVKFRYGSTRLSLIVHGGLHALGTPDEPVVFTSDRDDSWGGDTNGDGPSEGVTAAWANIQFHGTELTMQQCLLRYGGYQNASGADESSLYLAADGFVADTVIEESYTYGVYVAAGVSAELRNLSIVNTLRRGASGIYADGPGVLLTDNTIEHFTYGLDLRGADPTAENNTLNDCTYPFRLHNDAYCDLSSNAIDDACGYDAVAVSGAYPSGSYHVWRAQNRGEWPYLILSDFTVNAGATLDIDPGVVIKVRYNSTRTRLLNYGTLNAVGSSSERIVFTTEYDDDYAGDTNNDLDATVPSGAHWAGIYHAGEAMDLRWATLRYGGYHNASGVDESSIVLLAPATVRYNLVEESYYHGVYVGPDVTAELTNNRFVNTIRRGSSALYVDGPDATLTNNEAAFFGYGLDLRGTDPSATGNTLTDCTYPFRLHNDAFCDLSANTIDACGYDAVAVSGAYPAGAAHVWHDQQGGQWPYLILSDFTVNAGATLTIDPGVVVKVRYNSTRTRLLNYGTLNAVGSSTDRIVFTTEYDDDFAGDTNNDLDATVPSGAHWAGIYHAGEALDLRWAHLRYGGYHNASGVDESSVVLLTDGVCRYNLIEESYYHGVYVGPDVTTHLLGNRVVNTLRRGSSAFYVDGPAVQMTDNEAAFFGYGLDLRGLNPSTTGNAITDCTYPFRFHNAAFCDLGGNTIDACGYDAVAVSGAYPSGTSHDWHAQKDGEWPYLLISDLTVNAGASLTIDPGVVVKTRYNSTRYRLLNYGALYAVGTESSRVVFTTEYDDEHGGDTNNDLDATTPSGAHWCGIYHAGESLNLRWATLRFGGYHNGSGNDESSLVLLGDSIVRDNVIEESYYYGVYAGPDATVTLADNHVFNTVRRGSSALYVDGPDAELHGNTVEFFGHGLDLRGTDPSATNNAVADCTYPFRFHNDAWCDLSSNTIDACAYDAVAVSGGYANGTEHRWRPQAAGAWPYLLIGDFTVNAGATLDIDPAVVVKFLYASTRVRLLNYGTLRADGAAGEEVVFTSVYDDDHGGDTNNDLDATLPATTSWGYLYNAGVLDLDHCILSWGGYRDNNALVRQVGGEAQLSYCDLGHTYDRGVYAQGGRLDLVNCTFHDAPRGVQLIENPAEPVEHRIWNCVFGNLGGAPLYVDGHGERTNLELVGNAFHGDGAQTAVYLRDLDILSTVTGNTVENYAVGLELVNASPLIDSNVFRQTGESANTGTGLVIGAGINTLIAGNTFTGWDTAVRAVTPSGGVPSTLELTGNHIVDNASHGLYLGSDSPSTTDIPSAAVNGNDLLGSGLYDLYAGPTAHPDAFSIDATGNWWGVTDAASIELAIHDRADESQSPVVVYDGFLGESIGAIEEAIWVAPDAITIHTFPNEYHEEDLWIGNRGVEAVTYAITEGAPATGEPAKRTDLDWLAASSAGGTVVSFDSHRVTASINTSALEDTTYSGFFVIDSDDPVNDRIVVPVTVDVSKVFIYGPAKGDTVYPGQLVPLDWVTWRPNDVESIDLTFSNDSGVTFTHTIGAGLENTGSLIWEVPDEPGEECQLKIVARYGDGVGAMDLGEAYFTIWDDDIVSIGDGDDEDTPDAATPRVLALSRNHPNPFNPSTTIAFELPRPGSVRLTVHDVAGRLVRTLVAESRSEGSYQVIWNGRTDAGAAAPSGTYLYRLQTAEGVLSRRMLLLK